MMRGASKPMLMFAIGTAALAGIGGYAWHESRRPAVLEVFVFDTPGLPSIFMRTPDDMRILIGGGSNADIVRRITDILPFYSRRIDTIIAPDTDGRNVTGLIEVLNRYQVGRVLVPEVTLATVGLASSSDPAYEVFKEEIRKKAIPSEAFSAGMQFQFGQVTATILFPIDPGAFKYSKASAPALCMHVSYGSASVLITGGVGTKTQKFIASAASTSPGIFPVSALATYRSTASGNISAELLRIANPEYLIYSQAIPKAAKKPQAAAQKKGPLQKADPLAGLLKDQRFNIREKGIVKIISDGHSLEIKKSP